MVRVTKKAPDAVNLAPPLASQATAEPITERIAVALADGHGAGSAKLEELYCEALAMRSATMKAEGECMDEALDPGRTSSEARTARQRAEDLSHEGRRIEAALAKIEEALPAIKTVEDRAAIMPAYLAFKKEREAFIEHLRERWPKLSVEMVELLQSIQRFDATPPCEIPEGCDPLRSSVEAAARGCDGSFYAPSVSGGSVQPVPRLRDSRITAFQPSSASGRGFIWPK